MAFIDDHREELGIEPIWRELAIAPSSYHEHAARLHRLFGPIGHIPPAEAEANYHAALENLDMVA